MRERLVKLVGEVYELHGWEMPALDTLTPSEKAAVAEQARSDVAEGKFTEYRGNNADVVFAPLDAMSGWCSASQPTDTKREPYREVREGMKSNK